MKGDLNQLIAALVFRLRRINIQIIFILVRLRMTWAETKDFKIKKGRLSVQIKVIQEVIKIVFTLVQVIVKRLLKVTIMTIILIQSRSLIQSQFAYNSSRR